MWTTILAPALLATALSGSPQAADTLPDVTGYPRPVPVTAVARSPEIPRLRVDPAGVEHRGPAANEAVRLRVVGASLEPELFGERAPDGRAFLVLVTRWENVHPRQRVSRASLEGRSDRTMGVSSFAGGGSGATEYVEADVAYRVPRLSDHVFALVDGTAVPVHPVTGALPRGLDPVDGFTLPALGSVATVPLAFQVSAAPTDVALQFFDYTYGNILVPVRGAADPAADAAPAGGPPVLDRAETDELEVAVTSLAFRDRYGPRPAPEGWRWAVVGLRGQSRSEGNIVQIDPLEYAFVTTDGGYLRYAADGSVDGNGFIRFTPEVPQAQELAFLVPDGAARLALGLRLRNDVVTLRLTDDAPSGLPGRAAASHADGDVLEVMLYGIRREGGVWIADLGVRLLVEGRGVTLRADAQFRLVTADGEVGPDLAATGARPAGPPTPFVVPPGTAIRFELVYPAAGEPTGVRYRGFRGEGMLNP